MIHAKIWKRFCQEAVLPEHERFCVFSFLIALLNYTGCLHEKEVCGVKRHTDIFNSYVTEFNVVLCYAADCLSSNHELLF